MKYRQNQCPTCVYLTETRYAETNKRGKDACGWDCQVFKGETKNKCIRYEGRIAPPQKVAGVVSNGIPK